MNPTHKKIAEAIKREFEGYSRSDEERHAAIVERIADIYEEEDWEIIGKLSKEGRKYHEPFIEGQFLKKCGCKK